MAHPFKVVEDGKGGADIYIYMQTLDIVICTPPCACRNCEQGSYSLADQKSDCCKWHWSRLSDSEARQIASSYIKEAQAARTQLKQILDTKADLLMKLWHEKSHRKRQTLLGQIAPEIEESKWIMYRLSSMEDEQMPIDKRSLRRRRHLLLPWLSVEPLKTDPFVLYALWHYRTMYSAADWAAFDCRQIEMSWFSGYFDVDFSPKVRSDARATIWRRCGLERERSA